MLADLIPKVAQMDQEEEAKFYPRPSSAGPERCIRQMVYHGLRTPKEPLPGRALLVFDDGNWHEELTLDWIRKTSFKVHSAQMGIECRKPMTIGHIDGIFTDLLEVDRLLEHKALNHFTFNRFWSGELPLDYLTQSAVYIDGIQTNINPDLKEGVLLIKNKNTAQYMEYLFSYHFDTLHIFQKSHSDGSHEKMDVKLFPIVTEACEKFESVLDYISRQTLPKRPYDIDHWRCEYCPYGSVCWGEYQKEFDELATDAMLPNEIADMVRYYKETGAQKREMEKEYQSLGKQIKDLMKGLGVREGRAGEYICRLQMDKNKRDRLYISKIKEAPNGSIQPKDNEG